MSRIGPEAAVAAAILMGAAAPKAKAPDVKPADEAKVRQLCEEVGQDARKNVLDSLDGMYTGSGLSWPDDARKAAEEKCLAEKGLKPLKPAKK